MALVISAQSGNWEDGTTWVGGVVPTGTDDVTITDEHIIIVTQDLVYNGNMHIGETVTTTKVQVGDFSKNIKVSFTLEGCSISGRGKISLNYGAYLSSEDVWSHVSVRAFTSERINSKGWMSFDLKKVTFEGCQFVDTSCCLSTDTTPQYRNIQNCVHIDCESVYVQASATINPDEVRTQLLKSNSYVRCILYYGNREYDEITVENCYFEDCTVTHVSGYPIRMKYINNSGFNTFFQFWNYVTMSDCYFASTWENDSRALGVTAANGSFNRIIAYGSPYGKNSRIVAQDNVTNSFIEDWGTGGGNTVLGGNRGTLGVNWTNNILLGSGDGFTSLLGEDDGRHFSFNCSNNTMYVLYCAATNEWFSPPETVTLTYKNNLYVCLSDSPRAFLFNQNGMPSPINIDLDYNYGFNVSAWTGSTSAENNKYVNISGEHNVIEESKDFPQFIDPTRNHETYAQTFLGGGGYESVLVHMRKMTGYDPVLKQHVAENVDTSVVNHMYEWLMEGFTPQNMELATAGEGGTYVGAIMPKSAGDSINFNGVTFSRVTFNGQEIPTQNIVFKG